MLNQAFFQIDHVFPVKPWSNGPQVVASRLKLNLRIETCVRWPNGLASFLTSTRESQKQKHFRADISCISLANNRLMDHSTCVDLGWVAKR